MATVTKAASSNAVVTTGWTNPTNAYASDNVYATAAPGAGSTINSDFGFTDFATGDIPNGANINSVTVSAEMNLSAANGNKSVQLYRNAVAQGTAATSTTTAEDTTSQVVTSGISLTDLRTASTLLKARVGTTRSGGTYTANLDYVSMTVDYTAASADLASLSISGTTLSPTFAAATTSYTATMLYANVAQITATVAVANSTLQYRVNGGSYTALTSGVASSALTLNVGSNTVDVLVTDGNSVTKTYTVTLTRSAASTVNTLSALSISAGTISPTFASGTTSYTSSCTSDVTTTTVTATYTDSTSTLEYRINAGTYSALTSGVASGAMTLSNWANTINVRVTAQSGAQNTYTITLTKIAAFDFQTNITVNTLPVAPSAATLLKWGNE